MLRSVSTIMLFCVSLLSPNPFHHKTEGKMYEILPLKPKSLTFFSCTYNVFLFISCSGTAPLACLVTMLHSQVRGDRVKNSIFFKLPGRMSLFTLKVNPLQICPALALYHILILFVTALRSHDSDHKTRPYVCILQKNALQWTKNPSAADSGDMSGTPTASTATVGAEGAEQESCDSTETTAASGENDGLCTIHSFHFFLFATLIHSACFSASEKGF